MMPRLVIVFLAVLFLGDVRSASAVRLFGLVNTGELFTSLDAGVTWTIQSTLPVRDAVALAAGSTSSQLFLASESGSIYNSTDAGVNWTAIGAVPASDVVTLVAYPGRLLLMTASGSVYTSLNDGGTWTAVGTLTAPDVVSAARHGSAYCAATRTGSVYRSTDEGVTWTAVGALTVSNAIDVSSFSGKLYVLTGTGDVARSDDDGVNWSFVSTLSQSGMAGLLATSTELLAATTGGECAASATGAAWTWRGAIGQLRVRALASDQPGVSGVNPPARPSQYFLAPWPNPSPGSVTLEFDLEISTPATVFIFDAAGGLVSRLLDEVLPAGRTQRRVSPTGLAAGNYFLSARIGDRIETHKLVLLRP